MALSIRFKILIPSLGEKQHYFEGKQNNVQKIKFICNQSSVLHHKSHDFKTSERSDMQIIRTKPSYLWPLYCIHSGGQQSGDPWQPVLQTCVGYSRQKICLTPSRLSSTKKKTNLNLIIICGKFNAEETSIRLKKSVHKCRYVSPQIDVLTHFSKSTATSSFKTDFREWQVKEQFFQTLSTWEKPGVYLQFLLKSKWRVFPDIFHHCL